MNQYFGTTRETLYLHLKLFKTLNIDHIFLYINIFLIHKQ